MDKNRKINVIISMGETQVHRMPERIMPRINADCGLWIFRWGRNVGGAPRQHQLDRHFEFYSISHMFKGAGFYWTPAGGTQEVKPGQYVLASPGFKQHYGGTAQENYYEDTINFSGPLADMMFKSGVFSNGVFELGLSRRLLPIIELAADPSDHGQLNACSALHRLLQDLYNRRFQEQGRERYPEIDELLTLMKEQPERWWTIEEMAEFCNMSDDQFRRVFRARVGVLPKLYADQIKLHRASSLLVETKLSLAEIAQKLGYKDQFHFSRRFKTVTGFPPRRFRRDAIKQ
ncbi:MAG: AraC family transcriptional regulator [Victivallaceae bacterium]|mgnify:CR=1 FL=1|nr:AraC family transcriptional regulator [Victivallaceae bacterium]MDD4180026.1 AraC family transcriptional regulator [Victivallaceae bacterium]